MSLTGQFKDATGIPSIEARVAFPDFDLAAKILFLLDTGAETTLLMPRDARRLGIDFGRLTPSFDLVSGVGGAIRLYRADASLIFSDDENAYVYQATLAIAEPNPDAATLPSLLGRDILNRWLLRYEAPRNVLEAEVDTADLVIPRRR